MKVAILFAVWPYAAVAILVLGLVGRWLLMKRRPASGSQPLPAPARRASRAVWLLLIVAHATGILLPGAVLAWNALAWRLYLLEGLGFLVGLAALIVCAMAAWRGFVPLEHGPRTLQRASYPGARPPRSAAAEIADAAFYSVLLTGVVSGLMLAVLYRWGSSWAAVTLTPYVTSVAHGAPQTEFVADMPFLVRLHVFTAFAALALFPFTSAALAALATILSGRRVFGLRRGLSGAVERWRADASRRT
ncbi:MAG TPA: respiratory nitrate reductase subunit gamma [Polyangiaceae bacterium]|nr:respiratory nitrate reductase subunit gamma [Polyangiaceae bacterium]